MMLATVLAGVLALLPQEGKPAEAAKWKADFKLSLVENDGFWVFRIAGTTNLPPGTLLRSRIYALELVDDFKEGKRESPEPLVWEDHLGQPSYRIFTLAGEGIEEDVYRFIRKPYSIRYRARIYYYAHEQNIELRKQVGETVTDLTFQTDLRLGTDAEYEKELRERLAEASADLISIDKLHQEFAAQVRKGQEAFNAEEWKAWKAGWSPRLREIAERNKERYSLWAVWMERQTKMRVDGMAHLLEAGVSLAEKQFLEKENNQQRIDSLLTGFNGYFEEAIEVIGIDAPLNPQKAGPISARYDGALEPLRAWIGKPEGDGLALRRTARRDGLTALLDYLPLVQNRKRGYLYINQVSARFTGLLELLEAQAPLDQVRKALEEHDAALAEFKKFAGLK